MEDDHAFGDRGGKITKRELVGDILKLLDPLGWLSPVILRLKIFMQVT